MKRLLRRLRRLVTRLLIDPDILGTAVSQRLWQETSAFYWAVSYVVKNQIVGDYAEFGVWRGRRFQAVYGLLGSYSSMFFDSKKGKPGFSRNPFDDVSFHAFDSFEGLPASDPEEARPAQYFESAYSGDVNGFIDTLKKGNVDLERVTITEGWFADTLTRETAERIQLDKLSIAFIDCDLYASTVLVLKFIRPHLQTGTVLVVDDWFRNRGNPSKGVQGALLEWLRENEEITLQHFCTWDAKTVVFIVHLEEYPAARGITSP